MSDSDSDGYTEKNRKLTEKEIHLRNNQQTLMQNLDLWKRKGQTTLADKMRVYRQKVEDEINKESQNLDEQERLINQQRDDWEAKQENLSHRYKVRREEEIEPVEDQVAAMKRRLQELRNYRAELEERLRKVMAIDYEKKYRQEIIDLQRNLEDVKK